MEKGAVEAPRTTEYRCCAVRITPTRPQTAERSRRTLADADALIRTPRTLSGCLRNAREVTGDHIEGAFALGRACAIRINQHLLAARNRLARDSAQIIRGTFECIADAACHGKARFSGSTLPIPDRFLIDRQRIGQLLLGHTEFFANLFQIDFHYLPRTISCDLTGNTILYVLQKKSNILPK